MIAIKFAATICFHAVQIRLCFSVAGSVPESTWCRSKSCSRGALTYSRAGHPTQKCCSSSTCPVLQELHKSYPLFYILGGQCICRWSCFPLSHASKDLWDFTLTFCAYILLFFHILFVNFGLYKTSVCYLSFSRWKRQQVTTCWSSLCESPSQELRCHQDCRPHPAKVLTWLALLSWFCSSASLLHSM